MKTFKLKKIVVGWSFALTHGTLLPSNLSPLLLPFLAITQRERVFKRDDGTVVVHIYNKDVVKVSSAGEVTIDNEGDRGHNTYRAINDALHKIGFKVTKNPSNEEEWSVGDGKKFLKRFEDGMVIPAPKPPGPGRALALMQKDGEGSGGGFQHGGGGFRGGGFVGGGFGGGGFGGGGFGGGGFGGGGFGGGGRGFGRGGGRGSGYQHYNQGYY